MNYEAIRTELLRRVGSPANEPPHTPIGRFIRGEAVDATALAVDLDKTDGCEDLAAAVRAA